MVTFQVFYYEMLSMNDFEFPLVSSPTKIQRVRVTDCSLNYEKLKDIFIKEDTPAGVIYLNYNIDYESFDYYTNKTIPYKYLDTVARKYMIDNNCKE